MVYDIRQRINSDINLKKYLRENSNWYKYLNRNIYNFKDFEEEVRRVYKLTKADKISKTLETIEMMEKILSTLK